MKLNLVAFAATGATARIRAHARMQTRAQGRARACAPGPGPRRSKRARTVPAGSGEPRVQGSRGAQEAQGVDAAMQENVVAVRAALEPLRDADAARTMAVYLKGQFACFGVPTPARRAATKDAVMRVKQLSADEPLLALRACAALWGEHEREMQHVGLDMLLACRGRWACSENASFAELEQFLEQVVGDRQWWDTIDLLASHAVADVLRVYPQETRATLERWIGAEDVWFRRTAILCQLRAKADTDHEMLFRFVRLRAADEEFWIRKAIGWALRAYRRTDAEAVDRFVEENLETLSKLSVKEAWKHKK